MPQALIITLQQKESPSLQIKNLNKSFFNREEKKKTAIMKMENYEIYFVMVPFALLYEKYRLKKDQ